MSAESLQLLELKLHRAPGIRQPFAVEPAGRGLVAIHGSNESGKSTLARALFALLWPGSVPEALLDCSADFRLGARNLHATHVNGRTQWFEGGQSCSPPPLPPLELARCYRLAVDEAKDDSSPLAEAIVRALAGGFDTARVRQSFQLAAKIGSTEALQCKHAQRALGSIAGEENKSAADESRLSELGAELERARALVAELPALEQLRLLHEAQSKLAHLEPELLRLAGCERVNSGALDKLKKLGASRDQASELLRHQEAKLQELRAQLAGQASSAVGAKATDLEGTHADARQLVGLELERRQAATAFDAAGKSFERWGAAEAQPAEAMPSQSELEKFDRFDMRWQAQAAAERELKPVEALLKAQSASVRAPSARKRRPAVWLIALAVALAGGLGGYYFHEGFWALLLLALALVGVELRASAEPEHALDSTNAPLEWIENAAQKRSAERGELEAQRKYYETRYGLTPGSSSLARLDKLRQRAADHAELLRARARLESAENEYDRVAHSVMGAIQALGLEPAATANGLLDQLGTAIARSKDRGALEQSEKAVLYALANAKQALEREQAELAAFFSEAGLELGDRAGLQRLVKDRARFDELNTEATKFKERRALAREQLQNWRGWQPTEAAQLAPRTAAAREASAEVERLLGEIRDIEGDVERRRAHEVIEAARANLRDAEDALETVRESVFDDLAATVLLDEVERDLESGASVPVLARAVDLFSAFTGGRHRLSLEKHADGTASFRAVDALGPHELQLDELSSGTRAQLLLAARLGFAIEEAEKSGTRPPLVLDEALATTDEARFAAISQAVLTLVEDGWQMIYLTSQRSDLARWSQAANGSAQYHAIELDRVRRLAGAAQAVEELLVPAPRALPAPGALSAEQYGLAIGVPPFDLEQDWGSLHVFHLLRDDLEFVHELMRLNVELVGVAESLAKAGGRAIGVIDAARREKLLARVELLRAFEQRWRVGRGRVIDREALQQAGVTEVFLERMLKLAAQRGNDAALLLEALANGGLSGFGKGKTEALAEQLQLALFIDSAPRAALEDILWRTAQSVPQVPPREAAVLIQQWWEAAERIWSTRRTQSETTADV